MDYQAMTPGEPTKEEINEAVRDAQEHKYEYEMAELEKQELIQEEAAKIIKHQDPIKFILDTIKNEDMYVGNMHVLKTLLLSIACQSIENSKGIQVLVTGKSGHGKTEAGNIIFHFIPKEYKQKTTLSNKAIWYVKDWKGKVIFSNDTKLSKEMEEVIKRSSDAFQTGDDSYTPLDTKRQPVKLSIPSRLTWWLTSVEVMNDEQTKNRFYNIRVDESKKQEELIKKWQDRNMNKPLPETQDVKICRAFIQDIKKHGLFIVSLEPYIEKTDWLDDTSDPRRYQLFKEMVRAFAAFRYKQNGKNENGELIASKNDFNDAMNLYNETRKSSIKLSPVDEDIWRIIYNAQGKISAEVIAERMKKTPDAIRKILNGRDESGGLLAKLPAHFIEREVRTPDHGGRAYFYSSEYSPDSMKEIILVKWKE